MHQRRVALLAVEIGKTLGLPAREMMGIQAAALTHDVGKLNIPAEILCKPGRLNDLEFSIIKTHPQIGYEILKWIEFPWPVADIVLQHHERMDGSGYPGKLRGENISIEARVLGVADVVEAIASDRPYRKAIGLEQALEEITVNKQRLYDGDVVDAALRIFSVQGVCW
jgi:HD-GYP domain-containing protein (c-di-GMP phosphodiesterase class II)